jgi:hypothetical protein
MDVASREEDWHDSSKFTPPSLFPSSPLWRLGILRRNKSTHPTMPPLWNLIIATLVAHASGTFPHDAAVFFSVKSYVFPLALIEVTFSLPRQPCRVRLKKRQQPCQRFGSVDKDAQSTACRTTNKFSIRKIPKTPIARKNFTRLFYAIS